ncbi:hypothetical protein Srufu_004120 [Streptomyces libani subsp. rufus]|nr:hypothetical protein Srufu_004120 [Streptomyces libani subsp. rufus]
MTGVRLVPVRFRQACAFVAEHHQPPRGLGFLVGGAADDEVLRGVIVADRPSPRTTTTAAPWRSPGWRRRRFNAGSMLYGAARRAFRALGGGRKQLMGCSCGHKRRQWEVVADGGSGKVLFTGSKAIADTVSKRYYNSVVREKGAARQAPPAAP